MGEDLRRTLMHVHDDLIQILNANPAVFAPWLLPIFSVIWTCVPKMQGVAWLPEDCVRTVAYTKWPI